MQMATPTQTYKRLLKYVKPYWVVFVGALLGNVFYSGIDALTVKMLKPLIDDGFVNRDPNVIRWIPILIPVLFLSRGLMSFASSYCMKWVGRKIIMVLRQEIFQHLLKLPARFYDHSTSGQLLAKLTFNVEQVAKACTDVITDIVRESSLIIFFLTVMFITNWRLTCIFLVLAPVVVVLFKFVSKKFRRISHKIQDVMGEVTHVAEENIESYKVVKLFNGQDYEYQQFKNVTEKQRRLEMKSMVVDALSVPIIQFLGGAALAVCTTIAISHPHVALSAGAFTTMVAAMISLLKPLKTLSSVNNAISRGVAGAQSIFELLDEPIETDMGNRILTRARGAIHFNHVQFAYEDQQVLHDLNIAIAPNQTVAFVGRSGSGKTTLVNLLLRFYDHYQGSITLDGIDTREFSLTALRQQFSMVSQHVNLFNDSIANNIAYGQVDRSQYEKIEAALEAACALEFVKDLPQGIESVVGENGVLLSGGQRQRLAIARALYKDAPILILDEATSALDTDSEQKIQTALMHLMHHRTTLIIAHRLSTIKHADNIIVLESGAVVAQGTHDQLLHESPHYAMLYQHKQQEVIA